MIRRPSSTSATAFALLLLACFLIESPAQQSRKTARSEESATAAPSRTRSTIDGFDTNELQAPESEMRAVIERYTVDRGSLTRSYPVSISAARQARFRQFYSDWLAQIQKLDFASMSQEGKVDYLLLKNHLEYELRQLDIQAKQVAEIAPLIPFAKSISDLEEARRRMEPIDSAKTAAMLTNLKKQMDDTRKSVEAGLKPERGSESRTEGVEAIKVKRTVAFRAVGAVNNLRNSLRNWYTFYNGYDPVFTWWNDEPYKTLDQTL